MIFLNFCTTLYTRKHANHTRNIFPYATHSLKTTLSWHWTQSPQYSSVKTQQLHPISISTTTDEFPHFFEGCAGRANPHRVLRREIAHKDHLRCSSEMTLYRRMSEPAQPFIWHPIDTTKPVQELRAGLTRPLWRTHSPCTPKMACKGYGLARPTWRTRSPCTLQNATIRAY